MNLKLGVGQTQRRSEAMHFCVCTGTLAYRYKYRLLLIQWILPFAVSTVNFQMLKWNPVTSSQIMGFFAQIFVF
jgi:hypothetical protein